jgi:hypothetical protein
MKIMLQTTKRLDRNGMDGIAVLPSVVVCLAGLGRAGAPSGENRFIRR